MDQLEVYSKKNSTTKKEEAGLQSGYPTKTKPGEQSRTSHVSESTLERAPLLAGERPGRPEAREEGFK